MCLDFTTICLFTGALRVAIGFMIASNIYTTIAYLVHERMWARLKWGIDETPLVSFYSSPSDGLR